MTSEQRGVRDRDPFPTWLFVAMVAGIAAGAGYTLLFWGGLGPGLDYAAPRVEPAVLPFWRTAAGPLEWTAILLVAGVNLLALAHVVWLKVRRRTS